MPAKKSHAVKNNGAGVGSLPNDTYMALYTGDAPGRAFHETLVRCGEETPGNGSPLASIAGA